MYSSKEDKKTLLEYCESESLRIDNLVARRFSQKLRNTIHYQEILLDVNKIEEGSTKGCNCYSELSVILFLWIKIIAINRLFDMTDSEFKLIRKMQ